MKSRPEHVAYLESLGDKLKPAGPFTDDAGCPIGSLVIVEAKDRAGRRHGQGRSLCQGGPLRVGRDQGLEMGAQESGERDAMAHWLFKSEPEIWSWEKQKKKGAAGEEWTGIRNYQARNNMRAMKLGERGFFYHSNDGKAVVGIVEVCKLIHKDSTAKEDAWECVDIRAVADVPQPVTLDEIKLDKRLEGDGAGQ